MRPILTLMFELRRMTQTCPRCPSFVPKSPCWRARTHRSQRSLSVRQLSEFGVRPLFTNYISKARCVATVQDIWCLPPDRALPQGFVLIGHTPATVLPPVPPNPLNLPPPTPEAVAAAASVDAEHLLTPPGSAVALQDSDSPDEPAESDDGSEEDAATPSTPGGEPPGNMGAITGQPVGHSTLPQHVHAQVIATSSPIAVHPSLLHHVPQHTHVPASASHGFASEYGTVIAHPTLPSQEVLMAQTMIPSPHAQHLLYFAHEVLRRSRTSCATLEIAMCYIGAIRDLVRNILAERAHLTRLARQHNCAPQQLDRRGVFTVPLHDPRRTFLASLVLATKFHQDRAYSNKAWAKLSGLPGREVTRCERALGNALDWRLWVGRIPPTTAALLGIDESMLVPPPTGVNGAGDVVTGIVSCGRCVSPPTSNVSVDMLEQELFQEELQNSGAHATFGGADGIPGERDEIAASFMEASRQAELTYQHVPRRHRSLSTAPSSSLARCVPCYQVPPACVALVDIFPLGVGVPEGCSAPVPVPMMGTCWHPVGRGEYKCSECTLHAGQNLQEVVTSTARWGEQVSTSHPPMPSHPANPTLRRSSTCSSADSIMASMISGNGDACTSYAADGGYFCPFPIPTVTEGGFIASSCEREVASPEPFDSTIQTTPDSAPDHVPVPKTPHLAESAIPISSIVGAFRPQRSPPPNVVVPSADGSVAWHPPPNL